LFPPEPRKIVTYEPRIFEAPDLEQARRLILTPEGASTDDRWERETPILAALACRKLTLDPGTIILDYGCGIGRVARELIRRQQCIVIGVDISRSMRAHATAYVDSDRFVTCSPETFDLMTRHGLAVDAALCVWVLQHCADPALDVARINASLRPGAPLFVVNNKIKRAVPVVSADDASPVRSGFWIDDNVDVESILKDAFELAEEGRFAKGEVADGVVDHCFWAIYRRHR
jgi:SAM-dependent methyltransferase